MWLRLRPHTFYFQEVHFYEKSFINRFVFVLALESVASVSAASVHKPDDILGSWYGQYAGWNEGDKSETVYRYMNLTVDKCDKKGNISGDMHITTIEGQGHDSEWVTLEFTGTYNLDSGEIILKEEKITDGSMEWVMDTFYGVLENDSMTGLFNNREDHPFVFARVSKWAKDEITEANALSLVPETLKGQDLSLPVTRAEFAAIALSLYEVLSNTETPDAVTPFTDISGNVNKTDIEKAYSLDITVGTSATTFEPNININREQLATMLCRTIKKYKFSDWTYETDSDYYLDSEGVKKFLDDNLISDYAKPSVYYLVKMGIINGIDDTHFAPNNTTREEKAQGYATATREQAIALSLRIYKLSDVWKQ